MSKEIRITLSEEEFGDLKEFKERRGLTWKGVLVIGVLEARELSRKKGAEDD